jgi:hypothetical protein
MSKQIVHIKNYISNESVQNIRNFFNNINDSLSESQGPRVNKKNKLGFNGCWDRQLHYEIKDNPIHELVDKLKKDFGNFEIYASSIRYLAGPFLPHTDIESVEKIKQIKDAGLKPGFIFLIPLWWNESHTPGTAFFDCPPEIDKPLYCEMLDILPNFSDEYVEESRNFSVKKIVMWENPGDLVAWENWQWHSSCHSRKPEYALDAWTKEFLNFKTWANN